MAAAAIPIARTASPSSFDDPQRPSHVSSSAIRASPPLLGSSHPSSVNSVSPPPREGDLVNPVHALAFPKQSPAQEVHIVKVTDDSVQLERGPMPESVLHKVGASLAHNVRSSHRAESTDSTVGPPPPSPPSSVENELPPPRKLVASTSSQAESSPRPGPVTFTEPLDRISSASRDRAPRFSSPGLRHRSSAETKASFGTSQSAYAPSTLDTPMTDELASILPPSISKSLPSRAGSHVSVDGYLQPPAPHKPSRRNTIGASTSGPPQSPPRMARMMTIQSTHPTTLEDGVGELAEDIEQQAEQIRRERKRAKAQQEAERALTRQGTTLSRADDRPLVGNLIGEDHVNYVLMYNMLTGIRIAVSTRAP